PSRPRRWPRRRARRRGGNGGGAASRAARGRSGVSSRSWSWRSWSMLPDADQGADSEAQLVARADPGPRAGDEERAVELRPVLRAEVEDGPAAVRLAHELRVAMRDAGVVVESDLGVDVLQDAPPPDEELAPLEPEDGHAVGGQRLAARGRVRGDDELEALSARRRR